MFSSDKDEQRKLIVQGVTVASAFLLKKAVETVIDKKTSKTIPNEPDKENSQTWGQAIAYAAFAGAFLSTFKLIVGRAADNKIEKLL